MGKKKEKQQKQMLKVMSGGGGVVGEMIRAFMENPILFIEVIVLIATLFGLGLGFAFCYTVFVL